MGAFKDVLDVDTSTRTIDVEGMTPYTRLADAAFAHGVLTAVVPQLKSITIGGACAGLGIEASSFRYGPVHETVEEIEVLLADGDIVVCTPTNAHSDLRQLQNYLRPLINRTDIYYRLSGTIQVGYAEYFILSLRERWVLY